MGMVESLSALSVLLGDRLDLTRLEADNLLSTSPLAFRAGELGYAVLFRYGVMVLCGLTLEEEKQVLVDISSRIVRPVAHPNEDREAIEVAADGIDRIPPGGPIYITEFSSERILVIADALAKSAALHRDEREVETVLDVIEPLARDLSEHGVTSGRLCSSGTE
jgi:uncharacterized Rmd1/YagE family protein